MNKRDYFVKSIKAGSHLNKRWVIEAFSVTEPQDEIGPYPYALYKDTDHGYVFINPETQDLDRLEGVKPNSAPFAFMEPMTAYPDDLPNLSEGVSTTYGQFFVNAYVLAHAFGHVVPYLNGEITAKRIESEILKRMAIDDTPDPDKITVSQYLKFGQACMALEGFSSLCVVSATEKTLTCDPKIAVRRKELLAQYKDQLKDPLIQAKIEEELKAIDREWMKGDPGERFYLKSKSYDVIRKKMFIMQGASEGMGTQTEYIVDPLSDGWKVENIPAIINNLRDGSFSRGTETALGGEISKLLYRIFQNTSIEEDDCGSTQGMKIHLSPKIYRRFIGSSVILPNKLVELTSSNIESFKDKTVTLRYPTYCKTPGTNFCSTCMGKHLTSAPNALSSYAATVGSIFMSASLKKMHGTASSVKIFELEEVLS